ncbi:hypothetical protein RCL1_000632 [Eukaryota sp. TZLM3-RCL]
MLFFRYPSTDTGTLEDFLSSLDIPHFKSDQFRVLTFENTIPETLLTTLQDEGFELFTPKHVSIFSVNLNCGNCVKSTRRIALDVEPPLAYGYTSSLSDKLIALYSDEQIDASSLNERLPPKTFSSVQPFLLKFTVDPLRCNNCAGKVRTALSTLPSIISIDIDVPSKTVSVSSTFPLSLDSIQSLLSSQNRSVSLVSETEDISSSVVSSSSTTEVTSPVPSSSSNTITLTFKLSGLTCVSCASSVTKALESIIFDYCSVKFNVSLFPHQSLKTVIIPSPSFSDSLFISTVISTVTRLGFACELDQDSRKTSSYENEAKQLKLSITPAPGALALEKIKNLDGIIGVEVDPNDPYIVSLSISSSVKVRTVFFAVKEELTDHVISTDLGGKKETSESSKAWKRFAFAFSLFLPVFISSMFHHYLPFVSNYVYNQLQVFHIIAASLTSVLMFSPSGIIFFKRAIRGLVYAKSANMDCLISLALATAFLYSSMSMIMAFIHPEYIPIEFFETISALIAFVLLGKALEAITFSHTSSSLTSLLNKQAKSAVIVELDTSGYYSPIADVPIALVEKGDLVLVAAGRHIPVDGVVINGSTEVDESVITGEFRTIFKSIGDSVVGGSTNTASGKSIIIQVSVIGQDSFLSRVAQLVVNAQQTKPRLQQVGDKISAVFVPIVVLLAVSTFLTWYLLSIFNIIPDSWWQQDRSKFVFSLLFALAVLVVSCPCAVGLATPCSVMAGSGVASENGILLRSANALEQGSLVTHVLFDKTGTLTLGKFSVVKYDALDPLFVPTLVAAEAESDHPISVCIRDHFKDVSALTPAIDIQNIPGKGLICNINEDSVVVSNIKYLQELKVNIPDEYLKSLEVLVKTGCTVVGVARNNLFLGCIFLADTPRPEAKHVINLLKATQLQVHMVTGDSKEAALHIANQLGISADCVHASCLPEDKSKIVQEIQSNSNSYCLAVGDGINDSGFLTAASFGLSIGAGTDIAQECSDAILTSSNLAGIINLLEICRRTVRKIYHNYIYAFVYNLLFVPIAAGLLFPFYQVRLDPMWGGLLMALSSISVTLNSLLLKRFVACKFDGEQIVRGDKVRRTAARYGTFEQRPLLDSEV